MRCVYSNIVKWHCVCSTILDLCMNLASSINLVALFIIIGLSKEKRRRKEEERGKKRLRGRKRGSGGEREGRDMKDKQ